MTDVKNIKLMEKLGIKGFWDNLSHNHKRIIVVAVIIFFLVILLSFLVGEEQVLKTTDTNTERHILLNTDTRSLGIDALNATVKKIDKKYHEINDKLERINNEIKEIKKRRGNAPDISKQITALESKLTTMHERTKTIGWQVEDIKEGYYDIPTRHNQKINKYQTPTDKTKTIHKEKVLNVVETGMVKDPNYYFQDKYYTDIRDGDNMNAIGLSIFTDYDEQQEKNVTHKKTIKEYLPTASIIRGVLLTGMNAPTGKKAEKNPHPVVARIQKDAILPNHYKSDIKECFVLLAGYGELSSSRAMLRGERLSCITEKEDIIDINFPAFASGEDGKAGLLGRVVERSGKLLAKTAQAGFLEGVSSVFTDKPVPVIQTSDIGSDRQFQQNFTRDALKSGIGTGASSAFSKLADYYMEMAEQMLPIIEIDAGRTIDIVTTKTIKLSALQ